MCLTAIRPRVYSKNMRSDLHLSVTHLALANEIQMRDGRLYPVHRIYCVGRNFAAHAREMGGRPDRELPFFFTKPADAATQSSKIPYPPATEELHHEVELVVAIGQKGIDIPISKALDHIYAYAVGVDLTRRDIQRQAKKLGRPWDMAKGFDYSAPVSKLVPASEVGDASHLEIGIFVNDQQRQHGNTNQMIWNLAEIISVLSSLVTLQAGDLIFTGTPEGVGSLVKGDEVVAEVTKLPKLSFKVV